jgi:hypothetical protein
MSSHRVAALPRSLRSAADRPDGGGVLEGIRERGIRCPQDVSVTGFDDVPGARDLNAALTTLRVPYEETG